MRILHLMPSFQHPTVRGPHRHFHFLRELSKSHSIDLLTLVRSEVDEAARTEVAGYVKRLLTFDVNGHSPCKDRRLAERLPGAGQWFERTHRVRDGIGRMKQAFRDLLQQEWYDVILFHGKCLFTVIQDCTDCPIVVDFCDATSMRILTRIRFSGKARTPLLLYKYWQVRRVERGLLRKTPHVAFISKRDREAVLSDHHPATILPNGVDTGFWSRKTPPAASHRLVFTGVMDYAPNNDAALYLIDRIAPLVRRSVPELEVFIVGRNPTAALRARASAEAGVTVTGFVEDVRPYLESAAVFAAPVRYASGTQNKVLEALAMEVPVVTTPIVAAGLQIDGAADPPVRVADGEAGFARALVEQLKDADGSGKLRAAGRSFVEQHYVWSQSAKTLEEMCLRAAGSVRNRAS